MQLPSYDSFVNESAPKVVASASFKDKDGYTVRIDAYAHNGHEYQGQRQGQCFIIDPNGKEVSAGYWMNYPEEDDPEWRQWKLWFDGISRHVPLWYSIPLQRRLDQEAKIQATRYDPLSVQFQYRLKNP